jgi:hypothetical protein
MPVGEDRDTGIAHDSREEQGTGGDSRDEDLGQMIDMYQTFL